MPNYYLSTPDNVQIYNAHSVYDTLPFQEHITRINEFLNINTKEVVILDMNMMFPCMEMGMANPIDGNFYCETEAGAIKEEDKNFYIKLKAMFEDTFGDKLCPKMCPQTVTLNLLAQKECNVLLYYSKTGTGINPDDLQAELRPDNMWRRNDEGRQGFLSAEHGDAPMDKQSDMKAYLTEEYKKNSDNANIMRLLLAFYAPQKDMSNYKNFLSLS